MRCATKSKKKPAKKPTEILDSWEYAASLNIRRRSPCNTYYDEVIDKGVNFFVLMVEQLGGTTEYSCEGHPTKDEPSEFYLVFNAPLSLVRRIHACGYFRVEMESLGRWSLRAKIEHPGRTRDFRLLPMAAHAWERKFGPLDRKAIKLRRS